MQALRLRRHLSLWLAIVALLMAALAPAVSQALTDGAARAEVCSSSGSRWVTLDAQIAPGALSADAATPASEPGSGPDLLHGFEHCPYCSLHTTALGLPPTAAAPLRLLALSQEVPALFLQAPRSLHAWAATRPRGPPAFS